MTDRNDKRDDGSAVERTREGESLAAIVRQVAEADSNTESYLKSDTEILHDKRKQEAKGKLLGLDLVHNVFLLGPAL